MAVKTAKPKPCTDDPEYGIASYGRPEPFFQSRDLLTVVRLRDERYRFGTIVQRAGSVWSPMGGHVRSPAEAAHG